MQNNPQVESFNRIKKWSQESIQELTRQESQQGIPPSAKELFGKSLVTYKKALEQAKNAFEVYEVKTQRRQQKHVGTNGGSQIQTEQYQTEGMGSQFSTH